MAPTCFRIESLLEVQCLPIAIEEMGGTQNSLVVWNENMIWLAIEAAASGPPTTQGPGTGLFIISKICSLEEKFVKSINFTPRYFRVSILDRSRWVFNILWPFVLYVLVLEFFVMHFNVSKSRHWHIFMLLDSTRCTVEVCDIRMTDWLKKWGGEIIGCWHFEVLNY